MSLYYEQDGIAIHHGDCLELDAWLGADVLITDPPYGMSYSSSWTTNKTFIANDSTTDARDAVIAAWGPRPAAVFGTWKEQRPAGITNILVWDKSGGTGPGMGDLSLAFGNSHEEIYLLGKWEKRGDRRPSVIRSNEAMGSPHGLVWKTGHPKPIGLMATIISASPPGVVADPFAGSGSTLVAAAQCGRKAIGIEIEERYCEIAAKRLCQGAFDFGDVA